MFETPFVTVTVETIIGVRVTTLTVDGWLSSVMTSGAFSSCALVFAYKGMEHSGYRDRAENNVGSSTRQSRRGGCRRWRRKLPERSEAERGVQIALRGGGKGQSVCPQRS